MRGLDVIGAVATCINATLVVGEDYDNIRFACICMNKGGAEEPGNEKWMTWFHGRKLYRVVS